MKKSKGELLVVAGVTIAAIIPILFFWYGTYTYLKNQKHAVFKSRVNVITDQLKNISNRISVNATSIQNLISILDEVKPEKFSRLVDDVVAKEKYISAITYYKHVLHSERSKLEGSYPDGFISTNPISSDEIIASPQKESYLLSHSADKAQAESIYMGWDLHSDKRLSASTSDAISSMQIKVSSPYLLDEGDSALDVLIPISNGKTLKGLVVMTLNITLFLPSKQNRQNLESKVFVPLVYGGELKNVLTSNLLLQQKGKALSVFSMKQDLSLFGHPLQFQFERGLHSDEFSLAIILSVFLLGVLLVVLSIYLVLTMQNLRNSLIKIEQINSGLEETVADRTKNLKKAHMEIKEILDNLDDAIMVIDGSYSIPHMRSPATEKVLGDDNLEGKSLFKTLFKDLSSTNQKESRHLFSFGNIIGSDEFQWTITDGDYLKQISYQCPKTDEVKTLAIRYSPFLIDGQIERMLIVASDITQHLKLQEDLEKQQKESGAKTVALQEMLQTSRKGLGSFMEETDERMDLIQSLLDSRSNAEKGDPIWAGVFRELHTLKGNSRFYKLTGFSEAVHQLEEDSMSLLNEPDDSNAIETFSSAWTSLKENYQIYKGLYEELFTSKGESGLDIAPVVSLLKSEVSKPEIVGILEAQNSGSIFEVGQLFMGFGDMVGEVADKLGKDVDLLDLTQGIWLDSSLEGVLKDCFTHAIRNSLDHGLETPEDRQKVKKKAKGSIWIEFHESDTDMTIKLRDDGKGIDVNRVRNIAIKKGVINDSEKLDDHQVIELLFHSGFSTKDQATDVSGRGVGLDAVREALKAKECQVSLESEFGKGSATCITIPLTKVFRFYQKVS